MSEDAYGTLKTFAFGKGNTGRFHSLPELERRGYAGVPRLPVSLRIVLESALRHIDRTRVTEAHVDALARWQPGARRSAEVPFVVARVLMQDMTGVPLVVDFAAMREAARRMGSDPGIVEPLCPGHLIMDHSVQIDYRGSADALRRNMEVEFARNQERYRFLKWSAQAFETFVIVPPGNGICHQVNLEYVSRVVWQKEGLYYPDTLVGTDSHTTMVNGLGVLGWGVGGIEAEAAMLGQPLYFLEPDVVGVNLTGRLAEGVTATDLVLRITEVLRERRVVGKFVEFHGEGAASLPLPDRATIGNMAPEYGATCGFFPVDDTTIAYLRITGRGDAADLAEAYCKAQGLYGMPRAGDIDYSEVVELDLAGVVPAVSGPRRPQDRLDLPDLKARFAELMTAPIAEGGYGKDPGDWGRRYTLDAGAAGAASGGGTQDPRTLPPGAAVHEAEMVYNRPTPDVVSAGAAASGASDVGSGDVLIAAITSCTNTSNPGVMLAAGLVAKKAVERGLAPHPRVKTSLGPGSRAVERYLRDAGLQPYLDRIGFNVAAFGCTTCIGNSGPLDTHIEEAVQKHDLVAAAVLSGNRNFEARIHQSIRANFLASPPLVVAFALAGTVNIDMSRDPLGIGRDGRPVRLADVWPTTAEVAEAMRHATDPAMFREVFAAFEQGNPMWDAIPASTGRLFDWQSDSTYIRHPPFFDDFALEPGTLRDIAGARVLGIFGDSITTDHISPAGAIRPSSPAGRYLQDQGVAIKDFNTYGARRGNHEVMMRGTFANVRIRNLMVPGTEGGVTIHHPSGDRTSIYEAAMRYGEAGTPTVVFGGEDYGQGSSRDWAAKGPRLLGVRAVVVRSFERIHRANLVFMGVLPLEFKDDASAVSLGLDGSETIDFTGLAGGIVPRQDVAMTVHRADGRSLEVPLRLRIDTPIEVDYFTHAGILPYVLRQLIAAA